MNATELAERKETIQRLYAEQDMLSKLAAEKFQEWFRYSLELEQASHQITSAPAVDCSDWLAVVNLERDKIASSQTEGPDGLMYPILSLCCYHAERVSIHRMCRQKLCACPCHKTANTELSDRRENNP
jgi:hypothetical protein